MSILLLACIGLLAGIGITAVGPGGVLIGWKVARAVPAHYLRWAMVIILIVIAPVLAFKP